MTFFDTTYRLSISYKGFLPLLDKDRKIDIFINQNKDLFLTKKAMNFIQKMNRQNERGFARNQMHYLLQGGYHDLYEVLRLAMTTKTEEGEKLLARLDA